MNALIIILVIVAAVALIVFTVIRNQRDKKDLVKKLNDDFPKGKEEHVNIDGDNHV
jgi:preprotein translocase subunit YajC